MFRAIRPIDAGEEICHPYTEIASSTLSRQEKLKREYGFQCDCDRCSHPPQVILRGLIRELAEDGYSGVEVRVTPMRTEIIIRATRTQSVLGEKGRRIRELTSLVQKRFGFAEGSVELYAEKVANRGLCAIAQAESLRYKLLGGLAVRRACYGVLRFIMENGAKGAEVVVSGKLRGQRGKAMKFKDGYMISSGNPVREYIESACLHVLLRQGCVGVKVKIMLDWDPKGRTGPKTPIPDTVTIHNPKDEDESGLAKPFVGKELEM